MSTINTSEAEQTIFGRKEGEDWCVPKAGDKDYGSVPFGVWREEQAEQTEPPKLAKIHIPMKNKISAWLNDKNNNENDLIDFLVDECGVVLEDECECGNNREKGLVNGEMRCEDCDVDGINYNGGLTDEEGEEDEVECVECSTIVPSSEAELTGTEGWGVCDNCLDEEEEMELVNCDFCGKEEDPDEIIRTKWSEACGECRDLQHEHYIRYGEEPIVAEKQ